MISSILNQQTRLGRTTFPFCEVKKNHPLSLPDLPPLLPHIEPLESVSEMMAAQMLDNLLRDMEESAAREQAPRSALPLYEEAKQNGCSKLDDPPPVYDRRSFPEITYAASQHGRSVAAYSSSSIQMRSASRKTRMSGPMPPKSFRASEDFCTLAASKETGAYYRQLEPRSTFDQGDVHPLFRTTSEPRSDASRPDRPQPSIRRYQQTSTPAVRRSEREHYSQDFSLAMSSAIYAKRPRQASQPPSSTTQIEARKIHIENSRDVNAPKHQSPQTSLIHYKNWIGGRQSSRAPNPIRCTTPVDCLGERGKILDVNVESPIIPKSFLKRHLNFQLQHTPKTHSQPATKENNATKSDRSETRQQCTTIRRKPAPNVSLRFANTNLHYPPRPDFPITSGNAPQRSSSEWFIPPLPSRAAPSIPPLQFCSSPVQVSTKASTNTSYTTPQLPSHLNTLPWQHIRPPYSPAVPQDPFSLTHVESWLHTSKSSISPLSEPSSPIFSEKGSSRHASTAPSSPVERGSIELEGCIPKRRASLIDNAMKSCITDWTDLDGCTPEFVHSVRFLKVIAPSESVSDCGSRPRTPETSLMSKSRSRSRYEDKSPIDVLNSAPEAVREHSDEKKESEKGEVLKRRSLPKTTVRPPPSAIAKFPPPSPTQMMTCRAQNASLIPSFAQSPPPANGAEAQKQTSPQTASSSLLSSPKQRPAKPHVSRLIIPDTTPSIIDAPVSCTSYLYKELPPLPLKRPSSYERKTAEGGRDVMEKLKILSLRTEKWSEMSEPKEDCISLPDAKSISKAQALTGSVTSCSPLSAQVDDDKTISEVEKDTITSSLEPQIGQEETPDVDQSSTKPSIPPRLTNPLSPWHTLLPSNPSEEPPFFAPKEGLTLHLARNYLSQRKCEWVISAMSSPTRQPSLSVFSIPQTGHINFNTPQGKTLFSFGRTVGSTRIAETGNGGCLFVVRERWVGVSGGGWVVTHKVGEEESIRWVVEVGNGIGENGEEVEGGEMRVLWGGIEVGVVRAQGVRSHMYTIKAEPHVNFCILVALTTVFDEWRVDEGLF